MTVSQDELKWVLNEREKLNKKIEKFKKCEEEMKKKISEMEDIIDLLNI